MLDDEKVYTEEEGRALYAAVERWQADGMKHPLTCPDHSDEPLYPFLSEGSTWRVFLFCPRKDCDYCQMWVPECVHEDMNHGQENVFPEDS